MIVTSPLSIEAGREAALKLLTLPEHPTAMLISNNFLSLGALLAIRELGLRCPDDIAVIGFDDHPWAAVSCPPSLLSASLLDCWTVCSKNAIRFNL